ncbi:MAG: hypothetical protein K8R69_02670 [Deltaproteobacteria bacterium]|nr:hypothetical protein [Deltaproteobacteria bacterium]
MKCGADIPKALLGKHLSNERVVVLEGRHKDLGLKDLGADEISDRLNSISWVICGNEYVLLVDAQSVIRDVIPFPPHSKTAPAFSGTCQMKGQDSPDLVVAVLENQEASGNQTGPKALLPASAAWKIDQKAQKFLKIPTVGLLCPRSGIYTVDGGL